MNQNTQIRCLGFLFDEELIDFSEIDEMMRAIEEGEVGQEALEVVAAKGNKEFIIHLNAVFWEDGGAPCVGWMASAPAKPRENAAYCSKARVRRKPAYKNVMLLGCPESIDLSAILTRAEAKEVLESLGDGSAKSKYCGRTFGSIFERYRDTSS